MLSSIWTGSGPSSDEASADSRGSSAHARGSLCANRLLLKKLVSPRREGENRFQLEVLVLQLVGSGKQTSSSKPRVRRHRNETSGRESSRRASLLVHVFPTYVTTR